jgi:hypothetical protein
MDDLDAFIEQAQKLASEAEEGRRVKIAALKGRVDTPEYYRDPAPGYDGEHGSFRTESGFMGFGCRERDKRA